MAGPTPSTPPTTVNPQLAPPIPPPVGGNTSPNSTTINYLGPAGYQLPDNYQTQPVSSYQDSDANGPYTVNLATPVSMAPRYKQGDELYPPQNNYDPTAIASLQNQLVSSGLLKPRNFQLGQWDQTTMLAYRELLGYSNVAGLPYAQSLANMKSIIAKYGDTTQTGSVRQPFLPQLTDPAALKDTLDAVSVRTMGRGLTPAEKDAFVSSFQGMQTTAQQTRYDNQGNYDPNTGAYTGSGGSDTQPDASGQAAAYINQTNPDAVESYNYLNAYKAFDQLLHGSGLG